MEIAHSHGSLHGMAWRELRNMLDRVELRKTYVLNPYAKSFVPRDEGRVPVGRRERSEE